MALEGERERAVQVSVTRQPPWFEPEETSGTHCGQSPLVLIHRHTTRRREEKRLF